MKTIKIRMLVAAASDGQWHGFGWDAATDLDLIDEMEACINFEDDGRFWIECEVPLPQAPDEYPVIDATAQEAA